MECVDKKLYNFVIKILLRITVLVTAIIVVMSMFSGCSVGHTRTYGDFRFLLGSKAEYMITKYIGKGGDVEIPMYLGESRIPIVSIYGAFSGCKNVTSVKIPNDIKYIDDNAFSDCTGLRSMVLPSNIEYVWDNAFSGCKNLHSVYFEGDAPALGKDVFVGTPSDFTIYYKSDKDGWSDNWNGYHTKAY